MPGQGKRSPAVHRGGPETLSDSDKFAVKYVEVLLDHRFRTDHLLQLRPGESFGSTQLPSDSFLSFNPSSVFRKQRHRMRELFSTRKYCLDETSRAGNHSSRDNQHLRFLPQTHNLARIRRDVSQLAPRLQISRGSLTNGP